MRINNKRSTSFWILIILGVIILIAFYVFDKPIFNMLSKWDIALLFVLQLIVTGIIQLIFQLQHTKILKNIEWNNKKREQAISVASLFAEWINKPMNKKEVNRLNWEVMLWVDDDLAKKISMRLQNDQTAANIQEILIDIRKKIQGDTTTLKPSDIVYYP